MMSFHQRMVGALPVKAACVPGLRRKALVLRKKDVLLDDDRNTENLFCGSGLSQARSNSRRLFISNSAFRTRRFFLLKRKRARCCAAVL